MTDKHFEEINEFVLKRWMQGITDEKVKFVEISTLSTDFYEENYLETAVHRCSIGKLVLKIS